MHYSVCFVNRAPANRSDLPEYPARRLRTAA